MRFTHFQVTFQQANAHLSVILINAAWTSQIFMKFGLQVGHGTKSTIRSQLLFNLAKHLINSKLQGGHEVRLLVSSRAAVTIPTWSRARLLFTQHGNGLGYYSNMATCMATGSVTIPTSVSIKHGLRTTGYGLRTGYKTRTQVYDSTMIKVSVYPK